MSADAGAGQGLDDRDEALAWACSEAFGEGDEALCASFGAALGEALDAAFSASRDEVAGGPGGSRGEAAASAPDGGSDGGAAGGAGPSAADATGLDGGGLPDALADGILAGAGLAGSPAARHVLSLHLARFFAGAAGRGEGGVRPDEGRMTPHAAGPCEAAGLPPFVAPVAAGGTGGSALAVPAHMHGEMVRALGLALLAEMGGEEPISEDAAVTLGEALAARLGTVAEPEVRPVARGGLAPHILRRVTERMAQDLAEELDLQTLAAEARLSPWHFARAFKQSTNEPPHAYRTRLRIEQAKAMLATTEEPVTAIAEAVGYDSAQSLARAFRKLTGRSPSAYRRESRA